MLSIGAFDLCRWSGKACRRPAKPNMEGRLLLGLNALGKESSVKANGYD